MHIQIREMFSCAKIEKPFCKSNSSRSKTIVRSTIRKRIDDPASPGQEENMIFFVIFLT